jgi:hypothetical protein
MNRRNFLSATGLGFAGLLVNFVDTPVSKVLTATGASNNNLNFGWTNDIARRSAYLRKARKPFFNQWNNHLKGTGEDRQVLLWQTWQEATGSAYVPDKQTIGDCVSHGTALACDTLAVVQITLKNSNERFVARAATEVIYAGGRVEIAHEAGRWDGMNGIDAAQWVNQYGIIPRGKYGDFDLSVYSGQKARQWAASRSGVPEALEPIAKEHPVKTIARIDSFDEAAEAIANGYPIAICSGQGFTSKRDKDGYLSPSGHWGHCMCLWGIDTKSERKGGCIANSWGPDWVSGPEGPLGCPPGCFWADAKVIDRMLKQEDSWAFSNFAGFPRQDGLDYWLI